MENCPACGRNVQHPSSFIATCANCGHRWLSRTKGDHSAVEAATFGRNYAGYRADPSYVAAVTAVVRDELVPRVPPPGRLLDVGCGAGDLMAAAREFGYEVQGIDVSEASAEICRSRGLSCVSGDFLTHEDPCKFDAIVMWDVIAHLRDPLSFFVRARSLLTERGVFLVKTPVLGDLSVAAAKMWPRTAGTLLGAPSHNQYFDRESLAVLFDRSGFEAEWMISAKARSPGEGGSLKRRTARRLRSGLRLLSGDTSVLVVARPVR